MPLVAIVVRAVPGGWIVESDRLVAPLMFLSGARAERQGLRLAQAAAVLGHDAELSVHDRSDLLVARIPVPGQAPAASARGAELAAA